MTKRTEPVALPETPVRQYEGTAETFYCPNCDCARCGNTRPTLKQADALLKELAK